MVNKMGGGGERTVIARGLEGLGYTLVNMRVGVEINVREWGEGVWANADEWQSGGGGEGGCNL